MSQSELRKLPSVDRLLQVDSVAGLVERHGRDLTIDALRATLDEARQAILRGESAPEDAALITEATHRLVAEVRPSLYPVINATGVIIHTNLGRAPLSERARRAMAQVSIGYSNLEYDIQSGARGSRYIHATELLRRLNRAQNSLVV
jgi:L-seryl-tRNA(Ser) seleniumtransferase